MKGEPFLSGMHPSPASLSKMFAQQNLRLLEVLSPRSDFVQAHQALKLLALKQKSWPWSCLDHTNGCFSMMAP